MTVHVILRSENSSGKEGEIVEFLTFTLSFLQVQDCATHPWGQVVCNVLPSSCRSVPCVASFLEIALT